MITLLKIEIINLANNYLINMTTPTFDMSSWIFCQDCIINSFCRSVRSGMGGAGSLTCAGDPFAESSFVLRYVFLFDDEIFSPCLNASFRLFLAFIQPIVILFAFRAFTIWMFTFSTCTFQRKKTFSPSLTPCTVLTTHTLSNRLKSLRKARNWPKRRFFKILVNKYDYQFILRVHNYSMRLVY